VEHGNLTLSCSGEGGDPPANVLWKVPESLSPYTLYEMEGTSILTGICEISREIIPTQKILI
jgi:hypothetical protein